MSDHTRPRRYESKRIELDTDECSDYTDSPHTDDIGDKGHTRFAESLHHSLDDYRHSVERLGKRYHSENGRAERDHLLVL